MPTTRLPERAPYRFGLAALTGVTGVFCFAPFGLFWLAPVVWFGLFALLRRAESAREAALNGLSFGLGFFLSGVSWVYVSLSVFGGMAPPAAAAATLAFCLFMTWRAGYRSLLAFGAAVVFALFVVLLFKSLFNVKIPGGAVYEFLPDTLRYIMIRYF